MKRGSVGEGGGCKWSEATVKKWIQDVRLTLIIGAFMSNFHFYNVTLWMKVHYVRKNCVCCDHGVPLLPLCQHHKCIYLSFKKSSNKSLKSLLSKAVA